MTADLHAIAVETGDVWIAESDHIVSEMIGPDGPIVLAMDPATADSYRHALAAALEALSDE